MSRAEVLARGRARADAGMTETITAGIWRDGTHPETGNPTRVLVTEHYSGPAQVKYDSMTVSISDNAAQRVASQAVIVKVPASAPIIPEGDSIMINESTVDTSLVGKTFYVDGAPQGGQTTSHRYPVKELP